ncbi:MAG: hypothetical protein CLLPBCKN_004400 [Chroococcidiopsis cubana SAG 39.79]|uniref:hypothetical protein n=1 Tax=Chroococcidiopsis cubana TaxID=171392 RepID=UPI002AC5DF82|nr:hypothetical protein [Chroococcidiopsis cubana]MDZ4875004.1 hypothetical protein [Chroococcidiopsis cubana SAG 39.79]
MKQQHLFLVRNFCSSLAVALLATELIKIEPAPAIASETPSVDSAIAMKSEPSKTQSIKATKQGYLQAKARFVTPKPRFSCQNRKLGVESR